MRTPSSPRCVRAHDGAATGWNEAGAGEPLLLISGQGVDSTAWEAVIPAFGARHRVITFDHRGTGHEMPLPSWTTATLSCRESPRPPW